jgi:hypothetical protein
LPTERFALTRSRLVILTGGIVCMLALIGWARGLSASRLWGAIDDKFPSQAASFIEEQNLAGPLFNHFDWGGYLIWRLPQLPVAIDGRTNLHGDQRLLRSFHTWAGERGWHSDPDLMAAGVVIADPRLPLASLLRLDPGFERLYEDTHAVVFVPQQEH